MPNSYFDFQIKPIQTLSGANFMAVAKDAAPAKKGRGLSLEEKRKRLCEYFLEKVGVKIFFQI